MAMNRVLAARVMVGLMAATVSGSALAERPLNEPTTGDKGSDMLVDLVLVRPLGAVATVIGTAAFVISLPFTLPSGSADEAARELVGKPAEYTFNRPLGDFHRCGADRHPCGAD